MNKKQNVILVGIIVAIAIAVITIAAITITAIENDSLVTLDPPNPDAWTRCAIEHGYCSFPNNSLNEVTYGAGNQWVTNSYGSGGRVPCNNTEFGDPAHGSGKECWYSSPTPVNTTWVKCAVEGGGCSIDGNNGTSMIKYGGANDVWVYGVFGFSPMCVNSLFGDPDVGNGKNCYYQGTTPPGPWVTCAIQGGICTSGVDNGVIKYGGSNEDWVYGSFWAGEANCNNTTFGDPDVGDTDKYCHYQGTVPSGTWTKCATEGGVCTFTGETKLVKYGAYSYYFYGKFTDSVNCNNAQFGDPIPGDGKSCSTLN